MNIIIPKWKDMLLPSIRSGVKGRIKVDILDAKSGIILKQGKWQNNLILNCGLDLIFSHVYCDCFRYGHLSTDTNIPVETNTSMLAYAKQHIEYGNGDGATIYDEANDKITLQRSFVFSEETGAVTYTKFYSSYDSGSSATPFNEILFASAITLGSGQQAKVTMALEITISPRSTPLVYTEDVINGVPGSTGVAHMPYLYAYDMSFLKEISSTGNTNWLYTGILEPGSLSHDSKDGLFLSSESSLKPLSYKQPAKYPYSSYSTKYSITNIHAYTPGSFSNYKTAIADLNDLNKSDIRSIGQYAYTYISPSSRHAYGMQFLSDTAFDKLNTQRLTINFHYSVTRST